MNSIPNARTKRSFQTLQRPYILLSNTNEIIFVSESSKSFLDVDEDGKYRLPFLSGKEWDYFLQSIRKHQYAVLDSSFPQGASIYPKIEGFFYNQQDFILISFEYVENNKLVQSMEPLLSGMDFIEMGLILFTKEGVIVGANEIAGRILGHTKDDLIKRNINTINMYFSYNNFEMKQLKLQIKTHNEGVLILKKNSGEMDYYELKVKYHPMEQLYYANLFEHTEYMKMQAQLKEQQYLRELGMMSAAIAHEIRNPLTALTGFIDLLRSDATVAQHFYYDVMGRELEHLNTILTDVLYLSSPNAPVEKPIHLQELLKEVVDLLCFEANQKQIAIRLEVEQEQKLFLLGNTVRLKQVIINLLKNSIQAMQRGTIIVRLFATAEYIQLGIQDEGGGMCEEERGNIFTPFYTTKEGGTGLGLSLVKKVVEDMNGYIEVESLLDIGTSFLMTFPQRSISSAIQL